MWYRIRFQVESWFELAIVVWINPTFFALRKRIALENEVPGSGGWVSLVSLTLKKFLLPIMTSL